MKYRSSSFLGIMMVALGLLGSATWAMMQQGFSTFDEGANQLSFACAGQCFAILGPYAWFDQLTIDGQFGGNGQLWYGFLVWQQIYPGELLPAAWLTHQSFWFSAHPVYQQIPNEAGQLVLIANGDVTASAVTYAFRRRSLGEKIAQWWKDFRTNEPLRPYSINLRYGVKVLGTPLVKIIYRIVLLGVIGILFFVHSRQQRKEVLFLFLVTVILLFTLRNLWNRTTRTNQWLQTYTFAPEQEKQFFDLGDYPIFVEKVRTTLWLDEAFWTKTCTIFFDTNQERPFKVHADAVYSKPCEPAPEKSQADYIIYYKKPLWPESAWKEVLLEFNGSFLVRNK